MMEGRDERGKMILFHPLSVSFSYLLVGCYAVKLLDTYFSIDYKIALDIVIASALLIYIQTFTPMKIMLSWLRSYTRK